MTYLNDPLVRRLMNLTEELPDLLAEEYPGSGQLSIVGMTAPPAALERPLAPVIELRRRLPANPTDAQDADAQERE